MHATTYGAKEVPLSVQQRDLHLTWTELLDMQRLPVM